MRKRLLVWLAALAGLIAGCNASTLNNNQKTEEQSVKTDSNPQTDIEELIKKLGADDWETREKAQAKLIEIGKPALASLEKVSGETKDPEVKMRLGKIIENVELTSLFINTLEARLQGRHSEFLSFFDETVYSLDNQPSFNIKDYKARNMPEAARKLGKEDKNPGLEKMIEKSYEAYNLSQYTLEDIIDSKKIEVLACPAAREKYKDYRRISRIFTKEIMITDKDRFVIAPCKIEYAGKGNRTEFNQLFLVGSEHELKFIFYLLRKINGKWRIVLLND